MRTLGRPKRYAAMLLLGCLAAFSSLRAAPNAEDLNAGYYLLHHLLDDESGLDVLLDFKHSPKEIQDFATEISRTASDDLSVLEHLQAADPGLKGDRNPLPKFEQDVRAAISGEKEHQLLFGTKNDDFARALLISQAEATNYAANLAKVMAQRSDSAGERRQLARISGRWHALNRKDFQLLKDF